MYYSPRYIYYILYICELGFDQCAQEETFYTLPATLLDLNWRFFRTDCICLYWSYLNECDVESTTYVWPHSHTEDSSTDHQTIAILGVEVRLGSRSMPDLPPGLTWTVTKHSLHGNDWHLYNALIPTLLLCHIAVCGL